MRIATWETAPQIAVRNCSKEAGGKVSIYVIFGEGRRHAIKPIFFQKFSTSLMNPSLVTRNSVTLKDISTFPDRKRCKN